MGISENLLVDFCQHYTVFSWFICKGVHQILKMYLTQSKENFWFIDIKKKKKTEQKGKLADFSV